MDRSSKIGGLVFGLLIVLSICLAIVFYKFKLNSSTVETIIGDSSELEKLNLIDVEENLDFYKINENRDRKKDIEMKKDNIQMVGAYKLGQGSPTKMILNYASDNTINAKDDKGNVYSILANTTYDPDSYIETEPMSHYSYLCYNIDGKSNRVRFEENEFEGYSRGGSRLEIRRLEKYKDKIYAVISYSLKNTDKATNKKQDLVNKVVFARIDNDRLSIINKVDLLASSNSINDMRIIAAFDKILLITYRDGARNDNYASNFIVMDTLTNKLTREDISKELSSKGIYINSDLFDSYMKYDVKDESLYLVSREDTPKPFHMRKYKMKDGKLRLELDRELDLDGELDHIRLANKNHKTKEMYNTYRINVIMRSGKLVITKDSTLQISQWKDKEIKNRKSEDIECSDDEAKNRPHKDVNKLNFEYGTVISPTQIYVYDIEKDKMTYSGVVKGSLKYEGRLVYLSQKIR